MQFSHGALFCNSFILLFHAVLLSSYLMQPFYAVLPFSPSLQFFHASFLLRFSMQPFVAILLFSPSMQFLHHLCSSSMQFFYVVHPCSCLMQFFHSALCNKAYHSHSSVQLFHVAFQQTCILPDLFCWLIYVNEHLGFAWGNLHS